MTDKSKLYILKTITYLCILPAIFFSLNPIHSRAEKADREKPINIEANSAEMDDKTSTAIFKGDVILTQGTLLIKADTLTVKQENDEFKEGIAVGNVAYFRQKREGYQDFIEGEAKRIEFDAITDQLIMIDNAKLWREGDEVQGNFIHYNAATETFTVRGEQPNSSAGQSTTGRVKAIIQPKPKSEP